MKKIFSIFVVVVLVPLFLVVSLLVKFNYVDDSKNDSSGNAGVTINVCNWGENIADGSDDFMDVNEEFTKRTGIKVNYTTFQSNEDLYAKLENKAIQYDVIIPSDYMVSHLIKRGLIQKLDFSLLPNAKQLMVPSLKNTDFDPTGEYSVVYSWGVIALIYNKKFVTESAKDMDWDILWNKKYKDKILMFNNPRDAFAVSQIKLGKSFNSTDEQDWYDVFYDLKKQKNLVQCYVMDQIFDKMSSEEAYLAPYYLGDALTIRDLNKNLGVIIPKSGTNKCIDAMCVPTNAANPREAMAYINFMCAPEISAENTRKVKYFSPIIGVTTMDEIADVENFDKIFDENFAKGFTDLDENIAKLLKKLWVDVKVDAKIDTFELTIVLLALLLLVLLAFTRRRRYLKLHRTR